MISVLKFCFNYGLTQSTHVYFYVKVCDCDFFNILLLPVTSDLNQSKNYTNSSKKTNIISSDYSMEKNRLIRNIGVTETSVQNSSLLVYDKISYCETNSKSFQRRERDRHRDEGTYST